jgi:murein DD-endopeptidase MepM/ murein hydrolase activator NlpD
MDGSTPSTPHGGALMGVRRSGFVVASVAALPAPAWIASRAAGDRASTRRNGGASIFRIYPWALREISMHAFHVALPLLLAAGTAVPTVAQPPARSAGEYRLPFADGTTVKVFDDFATHRPVGRVDLFAVAGQRPYRVVAAAAGRIVAIQDGYGEQQSGRAAADCHNNYVWIAHPNGEWTNYSHVAQGSVTKKAGLKVGDHVEAGQYLGDEGAVGCAMLEHVHFEVATPDPAAPIDGGGFLLDNAGGKRERNPRFCGVAGATVVKDQAYRAVACTDAAVPTAPARS